MKYSKTAFLTITIYLSNLRPNGNKHNNVLIGIFQEFSALWESFLKKFSAESNLNRFLIFSNEKYFDCFVMEQLKLLPSICVSRQFLKKIFTSIYPQWIQIIIKNSKSRNQHRLLNNFFQKVSCYVVGSCF